VASTLHEHFNRGNCRGLDNLSVQILHVLDAKDDRGNPVDNKTAETLLKEIETLWINRLMCEYPQGLNWISHDPRIRH